MFADLRLHTRVVSALHEAKAHVVKFVASTQQHRELLETASYELDSQKSEVAQLRAQLSSSQSQLAGLGAQHTALERESKDMSEQLREALRQLTAVEGVLIDWEAGLSSQRCVV